MGHPRSGAPRRARLLSAALSLAVGTVAYAATPASAYEADVTRTTGGIAHIKADTLGDAGFGVGYAQAQDNICTLADTYLTARGERAEFLGGSTANVNSDFYWRANREDRVV